MVDKKPRAKPISLFPMSFDEAVRRAIEAGPYRPDDEPTDDPRAGDTGLVAPRAGRRASQAARKSAKPKRGTSRRR